MIIFVRPNQTPDDHRAKRRGHPTSADGGEGLLHGDSRAQGSERAYVRMARKNTRFSEQPIRGVVRRRHWNLRLLACELGVGYCHLINSANGVTRPSRDLQQKLSKFFDLPVERLFTDEALAAEYHEGRARGGKISRRYGRRAA